MKKSQTVTNQPVKESERLDTQIGEIREHIAALNIELSGVDRQMTMLVTQEDLDEQAVESLRVRKVAIIADLALFNQRLSIFKEKKAEAEKQEAQERVAEIETEILELSEQGASLLEKYRGGLSDAEQIVRAIDALQRQRFLLFHEAEYVAIHHGLPAATLAKIELPAVEDLRELSAAISFIPRRSGNYSDEWSRKLTRLKSQREQSQREPAPIQVRSAEPRPEPVRVTIPARPDHSGDDRPSHLQQLLRG